MKQAWSKHSLKKTWEKNVLNKLIATEQDYSQQKRKVGMVEGGGRYLAIFQPRRLLTIYTNTSNKCKKMMLHLGPLSLTEDSHIYIWHSDLYIYLLSPSFHVKKNHRKGQVNRMDSYF